MTPESFKKAKSIMWKLGKLRELKSEFKTSSSEYCPNITWGELRSFFPEFEKIISEEIKLLDKEMEDL